MQNLEIGSINGSWDNFEVTYNQAGEPNNQGHLTITYLFPDDKYQVTGTNTAGETVNETVDVQEGQEEVTPEQIFWLIADVLTATLCPQCGTTDPE